jgi:type IV pilus assembly protein PilO
MNLEEFFLNFSKTQRLLMVAGACLVFSLLFYFFLVSDKLDDIDKLKQDATKINQEIQKLSQGLGQTKPALRQKDEQDRIMREMVASFPDTEQIEELLADVDSLLKESSLVALKFQPGEKEPREEYSYTEIPIHITVLGGYAKQANFLQRLYQLPRLVNVQRLELSYIKDSETKGAQPTQTPSTSEKPVVSEKRPSRSPSDQTTELTDKALSLEGKLTLLTYRRMLIGEGGRKKNPAKPKGQGETTK